MNHKASLLTLPQGPVQSLPVWGGTFYKIAFRLGSKYLLSNRLVCDGTGEKDKASQAMGGHQAWQPWVGQSWDRIERKALGVMMTGITQGWPPFLGSGGWEQRKERRRDGCCQRHMVGREALGQS